LNHAGPFGPGAQAYMPECMFCSIAIKFYDHGHGHIRCIFTSPGFSRIDKSPLKQLVANEQKKKILSTFWQSSENNHLAHGN
jgi:hypothetical protein